MNQPELGRKLSELRKARGMTQEELVEKCNLSVRTIQRIEAGEVTPRSYTVKALFEALNHPWEELREEPSEATPKAPKYLYLAFAFGLVYFFLAFFEIGREYEWIFDENRGNPTAFLAIKIGTFLTYAVFLLGWIKLETFLPNRWLSIALWTTLGANAVWYGVESYALLSGKLDLEDLHAVKLSSFGFCYAFLGVGYWAYRTIWSPVAQAVGAMGVLAGAFLFSVIGVVFGLIPLTLFEIGQLGLMVSAINRIGRTPAQEVATPVGVVSTAAE